MGEGFCGTLEEGQHHRYCKIARKLLPAYIRLWLSRTLLGRIG